MKIHAVLQGTTEWLNLRAGIPTASEFDKILTPGGKASASAEKYLFALLAERIMGHPRIEAVSTWMNRGSEMEAEAVSFYEFQRDRETTPVGFITNDAGTIGASPDRLVGADGLLEIKVPAEHTHVSYLLKKAVDQAYFPQVQGQLWISERKWLDILSYHPEMPPALIRVERDETFIAALAEAVGHFSIMLEEYACDLKKRGWIKEKPVQEATVPDMGEFLSQEDEEYAQAQAEPAQASPAPPAATECTCGCEFLTHGTDNGLTICNCEPSCPALPVQRKRDVTADIKTFLETMARAKASIGTEKYYGILGMHGFTHANECKSVKTRRVLLLAMIAAHKNSGPGPTPAVDGPLLAGPAPGSQAPASNIPPAASPKAPPAPHVPAEPSADAERERMDLKLWLENYTGCSVAEIDAHLTRNLTATERKQHVRVMERLRALQMLPAQRCKEAILGAREGALRL